jgi:hypothetical protein
MWNSRKKTRGHENKRGTTEMWKGKKGRGIKKVYRTNEYDPSTIYACMGTS